MHFKYLSIIVCFFLFIITVYQDPIFSNFFDPAVSQDIFPRVRPTNNGDDTDIHHLIPNDYSYYNESVNYFPVNGTWYEKNHIAERQSGEGFTARRRSCRFLTRRQCRGGQNNLLNRNDETDEIMVTAESRPIVDSYFYPKGNVANPHVHVYGI